MQLMFAMLRVINEDIRMRPNDTGAVIMPNDTNEGQLTDYKVTS